MNKITRLFIGFFVLLSFSSEVFGAGVFLNQKKEPKIVISEPNTIETTKNPIAPISVTLPKNVKQQTQEPLELEKPTKKEEIKAIETLDKENYATPLLKKGKITQI